MVVPKRSIVWTLVCVILVSALVRGALSCEGKDVERIVDVLEEVQDWEGLAGRLNFDTISIRTNCDTHIWQARCYRRQLVRTYCDLLPSGSTVKVIATISSILDEMKKKRQAHKLKELTFSKHSQIYNIVDDLPSAGVITSLILIFSVIVIFIVKYEYTENWKGALEHILRYTPRKKLDQEVSPSDLPEIAKRLPNWRLLAPHLDITQEQEEEIIGDYPSDLELQSLKCLQKWSRDQHSEATYRALANAICEIRNADLIDCMCTLLCSQSSPPHNKTIQHYADILRLNYIRLRPPYIFEGDESGPSPSEQYINLVMTTREKAQRGGVDDEHLSLAIHGDTPGMADYMMKKGQKVPVDVKGIFSKECKVILIEGAPGSGKTFFFRYIVQKWAVHELYEQFSLVLLIQLRDREIQKAQRLADLLPFEYNLAEREAITGDIERRNGEGILLLFDGWDELPKDKQRNSIFFDILKNPSKYSLLKAAVGITSRPIVSTIIQEFATTRTEILGFTPTQIENYIRESLQQKEAEKLISTIGEEPTLKENCYLPLSLAIITHTYITLKHKLPETFCRIIIELALSCLFRHIKKHTPYGYLYLTLNSFDDLQDSMKDEFNSLCKRAYDSILEQKYSFTDPDMPTLGLMQSVQSFAVRGKSTQHYFLHLSLQELCAAWHLVKLPPSEQEKVLPDYLMMETAFQMENVLGFFSALNGWKSQNNKKLLFHYAICSEKFGPYMCAQPRSLTYLQYFHEAQSAELYQSIHSIIHIDFSNTSRHTAHDIVAMRSLICNKSLKSLALNRISGEHLKVLKPALRKNMPEQLCIGNGIHLGHEEWKIIADLIKKTALNGFSCSIAEITSADIDRLGRALQHCQLTAFSLLFINIGDTGLQQLVKYVENSGLTHLGLECCEIGDRGIRSLCAILPKTKLGSLDLGGNNISSRGLTVLADAIMNTPNFSRIQFGVSKARPGRDMQEFLERVLSHQNLIRIVIKALIVNEKLREYLRDFDTRRLKLGLKKVNIIVTDERKDSHSDVMYLFLPPAECLL